MTKGLLASISDALTESRFFAPMPANHKKGKTRYVFVMEWQPMPGDAVPEPLAFFALRQQHGVRARRCHHADGIAHATGLLPSRNAGLRPGAGCLPAEPYPPQQRLQITHSGCCQQEAGRARPSCYWPKAKNAGVWGRAPRSPWVDKLGRMISENVGLLGR